MLAKRITIFVVAAVVISALALPVAAATMKDTPDVVAVVNGEQITKQMLADTMFDWSSAMTLDELIDQRIVAQEAKKAGVTVSTQEINARINEVKQRIPPGQTFEEALKGVGLTPGHFFSRIKFEMQIRAILKKQIKVTDEDLTGYVKASHILVRVPYTQDPEDRKKKDEEAKAKIESIAKEIQGGLSFADAAKKYSDDTSNKDKGGDLGFFGKNYMAPEFEEAAFKLKPGEMSTPVKTSFGYHLIKLDKTGKEASVAERKDLTDKISEQRFGEKWQDWLLGVKNAAKVDNKIAPKKPEPKKAEPAKVVPGKPAKTAPAKAPANGDTPPAPPADK